MRIPPTVAFRVLVVIALALVPLARGPWRGSEQLLANAASASWSRRLAVWNTDAARAGDEPAAWYASTEPVVRRYVRLAPSALMTLEIATFGSRPWALRLVTLALHLVACWLGLRLLARWTSDVEKAAAIVLLVGLHAAAFDVVSWESSQAIAVAAVFSLAAASFLIASRERGWAMLPFAAAIASTFLAMTSYEAATVLPLALLPLLRAGPARDRGSESPRRAPVWLPVALITTYPVYGALMWSATRGSTHATYRAAPGEALATLAGDFAGYLTRTVLYFFLGDGVIARLRIPVAVMVVAAAVIGVALLRRSRRSPDWRMSVVAGIAIYLIFLLPPLLTRATVSVLNRPSHRQLYLPLAGVAILLAVVPGPMTRRRRTTVIAAALLAATASVAIFIRRAPPEGYDSLRASVRRALADASADQPVLVVGRGRCEGRWATHEYRVEYDAGARQVIALLPFDRDGGAPALRLTGERTIEAQAPDGFDIDVAPRARSGRIPLRPPPIVVAGTQRAEFGRVDVVERRADGTIEDLAITLDRPVAEHVVLLLDGCAEARRLPVVLAR